MGGVGNGAAEEDLCWDLNLGAVAIGTEDHAVLEEKEDHVVFGGEGRGLRSFGRVNRKGPCGFKGGERNTQFWRRRERTMWFWGVPCCHAA